VRRNTLVRAKHRQYFEASARLPMSLLQVCVWDCTFCR
jgi:hypothetical protein